MSCIYKRKHSPYFWWSAYYKGKKYKRSTKMTQQRLARKVQTNWDLKMIEGDLSFLNIEEFKKQNELLILDLIDEFLKLRERKSENTYKTAKSATNKLFKYLKVKKIKFIQEITLDHLNDYVDWINCSSKTIKNHFIVIRLMFEHAIKCGYIDKNTAKDVTLPTIDSNPYRNLNDEDLLLILQDSGKWNVFYQFLYYTGLRAGDVALLKYSDINWQKKAITSFVRKSDRTHVFPIADNLLELISKKNEDSPVFTDLYSTSERKLNDNLAKPRKYMQKLLNKAGRPKASLHCFRTTFNNRLRDLGLPIEDRQILLAQSASETTKIYTHPNFELARNYINKIPNPMGL